MNLITDNLLAMLSDDRPALARSLGDEIERLRAEVERLRSALVANDDGATAYLNGWHARDAEVERLLRIEIQLRKLNGVMLDELRCLVTLLDGPCQLPDGSNASTVLAHELLGDFDEVEPHVD